MPRIHHTNHAGSGSLRGPRIALTVAALALLPAAKNNCGSAESVETLRSPVQAVATVLERSDGTVDANLVLVSTSASPHQFVDSATNVALRVPSGDMLGLSLGESGHYRASSADEPKLTYEGGATYQFSFELDDEAAAGEVAGGSFMAVMDAPDDAVSFNVDVPPEFAGDLSEVSWEPKSRYGLLHIRRDDTGELTYSTFDFEEPHFDGDKWARLRKGGRLELAVDAFPDAGSYTLSFCAVDKVSDFDKSLSAELGALSGFLAGRCVEDAKITVE